MRNVTYGLALAITCLFFLSLIPRFNGFPTGIDAPHHITWARSFVENTYPPAFLWEGSNPSPYPLPEIIFALLHDITGFDYEVLFSYLVIGFVVAVILMVAMIAYRLFGYYESLFVIMGGTALPFFGEHISIGTLAEVYGTFILFFIVYAAIMRKYWLAVVLAAIGFFSHPFVVLFLGVFGSAVAPFLLFRRRTMVFVKQHRRLMYGVAVGAAALIAFMVITFDAIKGTRLVNALLSDDFIIKGGKAYQWEEIVFRNGVMPYVYLLAIVGIWLVLRKKEEITPFLLPLLPLLVALPFNHLFFVNIEPYRFISYVELFALLFASHALVRFSLKVIALLQKNVFPTVVLVSAVVILVFTAGVGNVADAGRVIDYYATASGFGKLPQDDLRVMQWLAQQSDFDDDAFVCTLYKWGYWIPAIAQKKVLFVGYEVVDKESNLGCGIVFNSDDARAIQQEAQARGLRYAYFSSHQPMSPTVKENFTLLYQRGDAALYQLY